MATLAEHKQAIEAAVKAAQAGGFDVYIDSLRCELRIRNPYSMFSDQIEGPW
jgi:hypothetical protein